MTISTPTAKTKWRPVFLNRQEWELYVRLSKPSLMTRVAFGIFLRVLQVKQPTPQLN